MKFIALVKQEGEGCDYTIACGQTWLYLDATTREAAIDELKRTIAESFAGEHLLEKAILLSVEAEENMPVDLWYVELAQQKALDRQQAEERRERAEFERLRAKFAGDSK